ncbi:hypothetical protein [Pseudorhodobacter ferrugineus]|uniref:hypothetical protein n=1 Tax=Pseudorhodobacter ferrugineus TaxID=77008 RepID=UPI0003B798CA|nr:hypothetical protein [Pseudorhodobacter ferrugineus]
MIRTAVAFLLTLSQPAMAEVCLGKNVRIGGHDASNQTFTKQKRGEYIIHEDQPKMPAAYGAKTRTDRKPKFAI